jgi:hypothetical protein
MVGARVRLLATRAALLFGVDERSVGLWTAVPSRHAGRAISATRALWGGVVVLTLVGVAAAVLRLTITTTTLATPPEQRTALSATDQLGAKLTAAGLGATPGTPAYAPVQSEVASIANGYVAHLRSVIHPAERPTIASVSMLVVRSASRAYIAIRRKDVARHREWMIRSYAFLIGIATVRVVALPLPLFLRAEHLWLAVMTSWWLGWSMTLVVAEVWIRSARGRSRFAQVFAPVSEAREGR